MPESPATKTVRAKDCQFSIGYHSPGNGEGEKSVLVPQFQSRFALPPANDMDAVFHEPTRVNVLQFH